MSLEVIQWQWDLSQNPFLSIASYHPALRQLKTVRNVSWHTADNTVSSRPAAGGQLGLGGGGSQALEPRPVINSRWGLYLWGECLGLVSPID